MSDSRLYMTIRICWPHCASEPHAEVWRDLSLPIGLMPSLRPDLLVLRAAVASFVIPPALKSEVEITPEIVAQVRALLAEVAASFDPAKADRKGTEAAQ